MLSKVTEELASLSIVSPKECEIQVPPEPSPVNACSTPKNNSGMKMKAHKRRSKSDAKHSSTSEQSSVGPDKHEPDIINAENEHLSCTPTPASFPSTSSKLDRYNGVVIRGKKKLISRQEMRALKAAAARASLQNSGAVEDVITDATDGTPTRACSTPKEQSSCSGRKVKFALEKSPLLSELKAHHISVVVAKSIKEYCSVSRRWISAKKEGAVNLQNFVGLKIDKDGNLAKALDYTAMIYLSDFSDVLKSMSAMCDSLEESLRSILDMKLSKEVRQNFKPFNSVHLRTIVVALCEICKGYNREYNDKSAACTKLMNACFHEDDKEDCTRQLNNIVNIWTTDIHINSKDSLLETFHEEMNAFGCHL
ncbi:hypothetical protein FHG87_004879 [Trinorchestia longiramus]|nr:hypothetical protein FHG87_004879 [Trinorchestia longiramus]